MDTAPITAAALAAALESAASDRDAETSRRFFKTGPGEYGEGEVFLGVRLPALRGTVKVFDRLPLEETQKLLASPIHEFRLAAVLVMVRQFEQASRPRSRNEGARARLHEAYLTAATRGSVNNWDIVDSSAEVLVGSWLRDQPDAVARSVIDRLLGSESLWERRIATIATLAWTRAGDPRPAFRVALALRADDQPLIHKATGWMLREVGKRVSHAELVAFLDEHAGAMSRTTLSYASEHLDADERARLRNIPRS